MQILGGVCLLIVICSVLELYKGILLAFLGLFLMDCVSYLKVLTENGGFKGGLLVYSLLGMILSCLESSKAENEDNSMTRTEVMDDIVLDEDEYEREYSVEDEEYDVTALRRLVKIERLRADMAYAELEKERMASASAAGEAMAMILRLQNEKSSSEMEAKQYRQLAEQKQELHLEMIESLQWDIIKLEHERSEMEENLRMHREKLRQHVKSDEVDQSEGFCARMSYLRSTMEGGIKDVPNLSLDNMDSSVL
ncbi:hypothetical protein OIU76_015106 [Salix suchowensis]|nr:hypothetical protein OIU76_015106 [Salix suchowensis]